MAKFCGKCGLKLDEKTGLCPRCDAEAILAESLKKDKKKRFFKFIIIFLIVIIVAACVAGLVLFSISIFGKEPLDSSGKKFEIMKNSYAEFEENTYYDENKTVEVYCKDKKIGSFTGTSHGWKTSLDGTVEVMYTSSGLYLFNSEEVVKITDNYPGFSLAAEGGYVLHKDEDSTLWLFDCSNYENTKIAENVSSSCISPNGEYIVYNALDENGDENLYRYSEEGTEFVYYSIEPISISNDGEVIYAEGEGNRLYYINGNNKDIKLMCWDFGVSSYSDDSDPILNKDHTQILYVTYGQAVLAVKDENVLVVSDDCFRINPVVPDFCVETGADYTYNVDYLYDNYYYVFSNTGSEDSIYYIDILGQCWDMGYMRYFTITNDERTAYYLNEDSDLVKVELDDFFDTWEIAEDVVAFEILSEDKLCYLDMYGDLYILDESKEKMVDSDVVSLDMTVDGTIVFMTDYDFDSECGTMNRLTPNGKVKKIDKKVHAFYNVGSCMYYEKNWNEETGQSVIYADKGNAKFKKIAEDICSIYGSSNWMKIYR